MSYSEDLKIFRAAHTYKASIVEGSTFHYVLSGKKDGKTLVLLNGGMNTMEMWMGQVTEVWLHRFTHRCITARSEDWF